MSASGIRHFLDLIDIPTEELRGMIEASRAMKARRERGAAAKPLAGHTLAMIFDKPSTRTRVSFDVAMRQLGGEVDHADRARRCSSAAARPSPTPRACSRAMSTPS